MNFDTLDARVSAMKDELIARLDELSAKTNRSRNELVNLLLDAAIDIVKVEE